MFPRTKQGFTMHLESPGPYVTAVMNYCADLAQGPRASMDFVAQGSQSAARGTVHLLSS